MKKTIFLLIIFVVLAAGIYFYRFQKPTASTLVLPAKQTNSEIVTPDKEVGLPVSLSIPSLNVITQVEYVGLDAKRNMDVPKDAANVGWYNLGPKPGGVGSAVMAGHLDDPSGAPAVFWDLKKINIDDEIEVTDENGEKFVFLVTDVANYPWDDFPLQEVFADSTGTKLNLITCDGTFDKTSENYSQRTVVYAELKN